MSAKPLAAIIRSSDRVAERQKEGTYHGDADQLAEVDRYCTERRLTYELMPPELDVSGGKKIEERPSLYAAIKGVQAGIYSGIVTANLKRLTRSRSGLQIWELVEAAGGHVHTAAENIDTSTSQGRFIRDIWLAEAVREREEHAERHAKRRAATVAAGMWRQRQVPRGYVFTGPPVAGRYIGQGRRLKPGPAADEVRQAAADVIAGTPVSVIADRLRMTTSGVRAMLRNRVYLGELRDGPNVNAAAHEPILDPDTFDAVTGALAGSPRPARSDAGPALLAGVVRCSECGHVMSRGTAASVVYTCHGRSSAGRCPAPAAVTAALLDAHVERVVVQILERFRIAESEAVDGVDDARTLLLDAERELAAYLAAVSAADVGVEAFAAGARQRREVVDDARDALRRVVALRPAAGYGGGREAWEAMNGHERNALLRSLFEVVIVRRGGGRGSRTPLGERVQIVAHGAGLDLPRRRGGVAAGMRRLWIDADDEAAAWVLGTQNDL